ncbi:peptidyl-prolyl cis-trans isomerase [bacterium]|nr:peptidyl-prolyl cis-trans isomerase [bacterium]
MLQSLRNNMRYILLLVAISFIMTIIFSWGMGGWKNKSTKVQSGILAVVNGQKILYQQFELMVDQEMQRIKETQNKESFTDYEIQSIRERVWNQTLQDILMAQEVQRLKIKASSDEIVMHLRNNPPDFIRSHESFQKDGQFDYEKYLQALSDENNAESWIPVENYLRGTLPMQKLGSWMLSTIRVSDGEIREEMALKNNRINVQYAYFNPYTYDVDSTEITDKKILDYYQKHKDDFKAEEQRKIKYVLFDLKPSAEDTVSVWRDAEDLIQQLKEGDDFAKLAEIYSKDTGTASKGGDLGFFGKGDMVGPFEEAAFDAKIGDIIGPVKTVYGLHIIRVNERKRENSETKIRAQHILLKFDASPETYENASDAASYFSEYFQDSKDYTFDELAKRDGFEVSETPFFTKGGLIPGIGLSMVMNRLTFRGEIGYISPPITVENRIIVFQISEIQKEHVKPLDEVRTQIERQVRRDIQRSKALADCQKMWDSVQSSDFNTASEQFSAIIRETGFFTFDSNIPQVGKDVKFAGTAFGLSPGDISKPVETDRGYYILKVIDKLEYAESDFEAQKESIKEELLNKKMNMSYLAWMDQLKEKARIEDFREEYF